MPHLDNDHILKAPLPHKPMNIPVQKLMWELKKGDVVSCGGCGTTIVIERDFYTPSLKTIVCDQCAH
jgi:hypothetical protein